MLVLFAVYLNVLCVSAGTGNTGLHNIDLPVYGFLSFYPNNRDDGENNRKRKPP